MRFELSEEQQFLNDTTRQFLAKELPSTELRVWTRKTAGAAYRRWWRACAALGWAGIFAPECQDDYGSVSGAPLVDAAIVSELAGAALAPTALLGSSVAVRAVGSARPSDTSILDGLLDGSRIATLALEEPGGVWNLDSVATAARRVGDGDGDGDLILTGVKVNVPDATTADVFVVACRVDDSVGLVLVHADAPGIGVAPRRSLDLLREFGEVRLDGVRVNADALLSVGSDSAQLAQDACRIATCLQLAESVGAIDRLAGLLLEYARARHAFGRPIGGFQALKHRIADITLWVESCKGTVDAAVDDVSKGSENADVLISVAKSFVGDRSIRIAQECTQMFGGIGLTWEHDAHLYLRRVTANRALLGTPEQHRAHIAQLLHFSDAMGGTDVR
ncbi:MAG: acyl-CoA dehydrogenase family protein [Mycobacterium sp.]